MPTGFDDLNVPPQSDTTNVKPTGFNDIVTSPLTSVEARGLFDGRAGFKGDSQYDDGLVYGMNQMQNRARNQPWYDQLGNQATKVLPGIALGIVENVGYLGELFDNSQDYTNAFTEFAKKHRGDLEEALPAYRENPEEVFDLGDSGWWMQHGEGLVESIGEFLVTGAGVGGALGKSAKGLAKLVQASRTTENILLGGAQLGTSGFLAYTEGAMSGSEIYTQVLKETGDKEKAAEAAAHTVRLNTVINTMLNMTSVAPMFKSAKSLKTTSQLGLNRLPGENKTTWLQRLNQLEADGVPEASLRKALLLEAGQEGLEEEVNLFAEGEGLVKGGLKADNGNIMNRFIDTVFSEEGALSGILGAVGGVGQTTGMELIPFRNYTDEDGNKSWVNNRTLNKLENEKAASHLISTFKADIESLTTRQQALNAALATGDKNAINKAREDLFNIAALKSIREGIGDEFIEDLEQIAKVDNTKVGEDGMTDAMRQGYADSPQDNAYRNTVQRKKGDIETLTKDYELVRRMFPDKFVADEVFRKRMDLYSFQNFLEELHTNDSEITNQINKALAPLPGMDISEGVNTEAISRSANVSALNQIVAQLEQDKDIDPRLLNNLKNTLLVENHVLQQLLTDPKTKKDVSDNKGYISQLVLSRAPLLVATEEAKFVQDDYNKLLASPKETTAKITKAAEAFIEKAKKKVEKKKEKEKIAVEKTQEKADKQEVKKQEQTEKAAKPVDTKRKETVGNYTVAVNKKGTGVEIIDNETGALIDRVDIDAETDANAAFEIARKNAERNSKPKEEKTKKAPTRTTPVVVEEPKPKQVDTSIHKQTDEEKEEERKGIDEDLTKAAAKVGDAPNKVVNRARQADQRKGEVESTDVDDKFRAIHSKTITVGTPVVLKVDKANEYYKEGQSQNEVPIGIYTKDGKLLGYVPNNKTNDPLLADIRKHVIEKGDTETTISDKAPGRLNWSKESRPTVEALPGMKTILIGKDHGLWSSPTKPYQSETKLWNNLEKVKDGYPYAIVDTPDGNEFAIPLDVMPVSEEVITSVMTAFRFYLAGNEQVNVTPEETALMEQIFEEYGIDLRTAQGFGAYFKSIFFSYNLSEPDKVLDNNKIPGKKWVQWVEKGKGSGIRFLEAGKHTTAKELGRNSIVKLPDGGTDALKTDKLRTGLLEELENHLRGMYYNIDIERLSEKKKFKVPLLQYNEETGEITATPLEAKNYQEFLKTITDTKAVAFPVSKTENAYFVSPPTHFSTAFLGKDEQQKYGKPLEKPVESATLKTDPEVPSQTVRLGRIKFAPNQGPIDIQSVKEALNYCA
jgi:hypothetical protein